MEFQLGAVSRKDRGGTVCKTNFCSLRKRWFGETEYLRTVCAHRFSSPKMSSSCGFGIRRRLPKSGPMVLLFVFAFMLSGHCCPDKCTCSSQTVKCPNKGLDAVPNSIPAKTKILFLTGNNISNISRASFPTRLELLTDLYLSGNKMEHVEAMVFDNLPNLSKLDLSNNSFQTFSQSAFPQDNNLQFLNLSRSFHNHSFADDLLDFLHTSNLFHLTTLDLSNNDLVILPDGVFNSLSNLTSLSLQNNSLISIQNATLKLPLLHDLDLRNNSLSTLHSTTLVEFSDKPDLHLWLSENPWRCNCMIEEMLMWLKNSTQVMDKQDLTCAEPESLRHQPLLQVELSQLKCYSDMERVLETSYVFLGLVLALIGVSVFLLVLYLNRKGIKRWIYNIRDACRDHMEGYHYRSEINSDPRLANLSINSDV